jgi:hypothetical protein
MRELIVPREVEEGKYKHARKVHRKEREKPFQKLESHPPLRPES